jgi:hypothetical protein
MKQNEGMRNSHRNPGKRLETTTYYRDSMPPENESLHLSGIAMLPKKSMLNLF